MLAKSPQVTRYIEVLQRHCYLRRRSDCYRLERPVAGWDSHPLKIDAFARHTRKYTLSNPATVELTACSAGIRRKGLDCPIRWGWLTVEPDVRECRDSHSVFVCRTSDVSGDGGLIFHL